MRLALVAACLLVVVAVTISPSSGNPAPGIRNWFKSSREKIKTLADKTIKVINDKFKSGSRGRRDVDGTLESDLSAISDLVSALEDASDIISSVEEVYNIIEEGSLEDDVSDLEDSDDETADDADDLDEEDVDNVEVDSGDKGDKEDVRQETNDEDRDVVVEVTEGVQADLAEL